MWKFVAILVLATFCVNAEDEQSKGPQAPSLFETVLCYASPKPRDCVRAQAARMLDSWDQAIEEKRQEIMAEADEEMKEESESTRALSDDDKKETPSQLMAALDRGLDDISRVFTDEVDVRESRAVLKESRDDDTNDDTNDFNDDERSLREDESEGKGKKGKKKIKKKHLMKLFFIGALVKSKIELLLKILSFKLQLKFFAVAVIGLLINIARFWIDLKKSPQKHHYEDHDDWGSSWKRQAAQSQDYGQESNFAHRLAYNAAPQYQQTY